MGQRVYLPGAKAGGEEAQNPPWYSNPVPRESEQRLKLPGCLDRSTSGTESTTAQQKKKENMQACAGMKVWALSFVFATVGLPMRGPAEVRPGPPGTPLRELSLRESCPFTCRHARLQPAPTPACCVSRFRAPPAHQRPKGQGGGGLGGVVWLCPVLPAKGAGEPPALPPHIPPHSRVSCELSRLCLVLCSCGRSRAICRT